MSETQVEYRTSTDTEKRKYAGFWIRFWAYTADLIIVFSINGILLSPLKFIKNGMNMEIGFWTLASIISTVVLYLYFLFMTKWYGQTLGKMIFGIIVIRNNMQPLKWRDLLFREIIGRFFYRVLFILNLLYLVVAFDNKKQGIHDMIGDTRVVHEN